MDKTVKEGRRFFLAAFVPGAMVASLALTTGLMSGQQQQQRVPPPRPPVLPGGDRVGSLGLPVPSKAQLTENQKKLRKDVDDLFALAQDLKAQADKMDTTNVLSVSFMDNAEKIEKLAKKIRDLARF